MRLSHVGTRSLASESCGGYTGGVKLLLNFLLCPLITYSHISLICCHDEDEENEDWQSAHLIILVFKDYLITHSKEVEAKISPSSTNHVLMNF